MQPKKLEEPTGFGAGEKVSINEIGVSGTAINNGMFGEEFLLDLQGQKAAQKYDRMRRRESQVAMLLDAMLMPILAANWTFEVDEDDADQVKMKELCEWNFKHGLMDGLKQHLREVLTFVIFGHSVFEVVHATEKVDALKGQLVTYFKKFGFRKQVSIHRWNVEQKTGRLLSIEQQVNNDLSMANFIKIPGEFLLVFTNKKEGDNYEGISALRPMYGAYSRKDTYLKLTAVGTEKNALGTPIGKSPPTKAGTKEDKEFEAMLEAYANNEVSYLKVPTGWEIDLKAGTFDPQKMVTLLNFENEEMARAVVASFLMLGSNGGGGSYSLGTDLSDFFLGGIQAYADVVCEVHNRHSIPSLIKFNYGPKPKYPELKCTGINDKAGKELADIVVALTGADLITADSKLEDFLRAQYKLTKQDPTTARKQAKPENPLDPMDPNADPEAEDEEVPEPKVPAVPKKKLSEEAVKFAEGYRTQYKNSKEELLATMQAGLRPMLDDMKKKIARNWKAATEAGKTSAGKGVEVSPGLVNAYKKSLREVMAGTATTAIAQARKESPEAAQKVKFGDYDKLNPKVKKRIEESLKLVTATQKADLEKMVLFQFQSSSSQSDLDAILNDIEARVAPVIAGTSNAGMSVEVAAADLTSTVIQNSRNSFFFAPEVLATIESFTFYNEDPVSEICQNLNGQTFLSNDPGAEQFYPPLHHNCKSRIIPNGPGEAEVTGIGINAEDTEERNRLAKQITFCDHKH